MLSCRLRVPLGLFKAQRIWGSQDYRRHTDVALQLGHREERSKDQRKTRALLGDGGMTFEGATYLWSDGVHLSKPKSKRIMRPVWRRRRFMITRSEVYTFQLAINNTKPQAAPDGQCASDH